MISTPGKPLSSGRVATVMRRENPISRPSMTMESRANEIEKRRNMGDQEGIVSLEQFETIERELLPPEPNLL
jgi:hypothetical protein